MPSIQTVTSRHTASNMTMKLPQSTQEQHQEHSEHRLNMLSHELRTPLTIISGYAEMLQEEAGVDLEHLTRPIRDAVARMQHVVDSLIDYEQVRTTTTTESALPRVEGSRIPLDHLLGRVSQKVQRRHTESKVNFTMQVADSVSLPTDIAGAVGSALNHVLDNAIKFADQTVRLSAGFDGSRLQITVQDDGPGLPPKSVAVFAPFQQGTIGLTREQSGLGMGLYLAKRSLGQVSGDIALNGNDETGGTTVTLSVPIPAAPALRLAA